MLCNTLLNSALVYSTISLLLLYYTILSILYYTVLYYEAQHLYRRPSGPVAEVRYGVSVSPDYTSDSVTRLSLIIRCTASPIHANEARFHTVRLI